jgi:LuxR family maltose regulon positive regulatory protein
MMGEEKNAERWLSAKDWSAAEKYSLSLFVERLAIARLLSKHGRYQESAAILQVLKEQCVERGVENGALIVDVNRSVALYMSGHHKAAKNLIVDAISRGENEGYLSPFAECKSSLAPLLADLARDPKVRQDLPYLSRVLTACNMADIGLCDDGPSVSSSKTLFTSRELEILKFIAAGYKRREIAERLFISPHTVKAHSRHIFEKLQVRTKAEAICCARETGLIDR